MAKNDDAVARLKAQGNRATTNIRQVKRPVAQVNRAGRDIGNVQAERGYKQVNDGGKITNASANRSSAGNPAKASQHERRGSVGRRQ